MRIWPIALIGGGLGAVAAAIFAHKKSTQVTNDIAAAISGSGPGPASDDTPTSPAVPKGGGQVDISATGYWPYAASDNEKLMEGGTKDRKGRTIITLEQHLSDPKTYPYVTVAGDYTIWPDGQRIALDQWPGAVFRICDTGGHFFGAKKVYRAIGREPLDIAVKDSKTKVNRAATATIFPGDNFAKGASVAASKFKDQTVVVGRDAAKLAAAEIIYGLYHDELAKGL
jgi:hypothetical protein